MLLVGDAGGYLDALTGEGVALGMAQARAAVAAITASPCGGCRQWLREMGVDRVVFRNSGRIVTMTPDELLPESFDSSDLT